MAETLLLTAGDLLRLCSRGVMHELIQGVRWGTLRDGTDRTQARQGSMFARRRGAMSFGRMPLVLDGLTGAIERIKATIAAHRGALARSEMMTRYALIDPLLRSLEWDTADPAQVLPEYHQDGGSIADYVLAKDGEHRALLEAKRLDQALDRKATMQALTYAVNMGLGHVIVTDGSQWRLYDAFRPVKLEEKVVTEFNVDRDAPHAVALRALHMWRPNLAGQVVTVPPAPVAPPPYSGAPPAPAALPPDAGSGGGWLPLVGVLEDLQPGARPPRGLRLPDGSEARLRYWKHVLVQVATWLVYRGLITGTSEIGMPNSHVRSLVSPQKMHAGGRPFSEPASIGAGNFVETNFSAQDALGHSVFLLQHCGQDPSAAHLRFGKG